MSALYPTSDQLDANQEIVNLVKSAQLENIESFNQLVVMFQDRVYNLAFRMLGDQDSAEDATQNAFLSAYRHLASFRGGSFQGWLLRIVYNTYLDKIRNRKRHPIRSIEPVTNDREINESPRWLADDRLSPEEEVERIEREISCTSSLQPLS
jgi:RNA polymerase sigma-70 factor (ECF subfamily)